jgi:hypothetical protein
VCYPILYESLVMLLIFATLVKIKFYFRWNADTTFSVPVQRQECSFSSTVSLPHNVMFRV